MVAAAEQSVLLQQISAAAIDTLSMTQQNASMVQETKAISFHCPKALIFLLRLSVDLSSTDTPPTVIRSRAGASALRPDILAHAPKNQCITEGARVQSAEIEFCI